MQETSQVELNQQQLDAVQAETAILNRSAAQHVEAGSLIANTSAIAQATTEQLVTERAAVGTVQAGAADLTQSFAAVALVDDFTMDRSSAHVVINQGDAQLDQSGAGVMVVGGTARLTNAFAAILIAGHVEGDVQTVFDAEGARNFGLAFGAVVMLFALLRSLLGRRR
jgi:hypothetical protein